MKIKNNGQNKNINLNLQTDFEINLNKEDSLKQFEEEILRKIINPSENYETNRFSHFPYSGITNNENDLISDIWYKFYFYNPTEYNYTSGLDYSLVGITYSENSSLHKKVTNSFFRLEFFKVENNQLPDSSNRKLVMTKNFPIVSGERVLYKQTNEFLYVPIFIGENYRNNEISFLYWFQTDEIFSDSILSGNTFYLTLKFFNAGDGSITTFVNKEILGQEINETNDFYYKLILDYDNYTYQIFDMEENLRGQIGNPITFYQTPN